MPSFMVDPLTVTTIALLVLGAISGLTYSEKRSRFMRLSQIVGMSISACVQVLIFLYLAHAFFFPDIIVDPFPPSLHSSVSQPR